ncbi:MAG: hypothetical protein ACYDAR_12515 [Thermomicrobiales bacterium]
MLSDTERRVLDAVEAEFEPTVARIQAAVQRPSITGYEGRVQGLMADMLRATGMDVDLWEPQHADFRDAGYPEYVAEEPPFTDRPNVVGVLRACV